MSTPPTPFSTPGKMDSADQDQDKEVTFSNDQLQAQLKALEDQLKQSQAQAKLSAQNVAELQKEKDKSDNALQNAQRDWDRDRLKLITDQDETNRKLREEKEEMECKMKELQMSGDMLLDDNAGQPAPTKSPFASFTDRGTSDTYRASGLFGHVGQGASGTYKDTSDTSQASRMRTSASQGFMGAAADAQQAEQKEEQDMNTFLLRMAQVMGASKKSDGLKLPKFKGEKDENAIHHWRAMCDFLDYKDCNRRTEKLKYFKYSLEGMAREWIDELEDFDAMTWERMKGLFTTRFSKQGKSKRNLKKVWNEIEFHPAKDDIEDFISDCKALGEQLGKDEEEIAEKIKDSMPENVYINILYNKTALQDIVQTLRELFEDPKLKKGKGLLSPENTNTNPFSQLQIMQDPNWDEKEETAQMSFSNTYTGRPWKPYITPRGRGPPRNFRGNSAMRGFARGRGNFQSRRGYAPNFRQRGRGNFQHTYPHSRTYQNPRNMQGQSNPPQNRGNFRTFRGNSTNRGFQRPRGGWDRNPPRGRGRGMGREINRDQNRCFGCKEPDHWFKDCPQNPANAGRMQNQGYANQGYQRYPNQGFNNNPNYQSQRQTPQNGNSQDARQNQANMNFYAEMEMIPEEMEDCENLNN